MNQFANSELILNENNKVYHLDIAPNNIAHNIITVGDPNRVAQVSKFFDKILFSCKNREFHTTTGLYNNKKITVISTGIGVDNIDIVLNELDALVNIDLTNRQLKESRTSLNIVRIGTTGSISPFILCDDLLISQFAIGMDGFIYNYKGGNVFYNEIAQKFENDFKWNSLLAKPYIVQANKSLLNHFNTDNFKLGTTITANGFYGPQARSLRLQQNWELPIEQIHQIKIQDTAITNLEMETAGIYALAELLGHKALSCNVVLAERIGGNFSEKGKSSMDKLIQLVLNSLTSFNN